VEKQREEGVFKGGLESRRSKNQLGAFTRVGGGGERRSQPVTGAGPGIPWDKRGPQTQLPAPFSNRQSPLGNWGKTKLFKIWGGGGRRPVKQKNRNCKTSGEGGKKEIGGVHTTKWSSRD